MSLSYVKHFKMHREYGFLGVYFSFNKIKIVNEFRCETVLHKSLCMIFCFVFNKMLEFKEECEYSSFKFFKNFHRLLLKKVIFCFSDIFAINEINISDEVLQPNLRNL